ncbi:restriction endonuclease [Amycolatopsis sp. NPDC051373]|uniref:restriction endonuclease n=1 Tax=Amycolatopsis sp. NPDC051373 TaxID=3155801 RepID=UPI00344E5E99
MTTGDGIVPFEQLADADLIVDQVYAGGQSGTMADDPLARLLPVGNQGGFRYAGSPAKGTVRLGVLYTTGGEPDWPDTLDPQTGLFTYYGDNRSPGHELHDTRRRGNVLLRDSFDWSHESAEARRRVPPFLLFEKSAPGRRIMFRGLLVPGGPGLSSDDELQAIWRSTRGQRFQNYRARFTVLDVSRIERQWISDVLDGRAADSRYVSAPWVAWIEGRKYSPMLAPSTTVVRTRAEQMPADPAGLEILAEIRETFRDREHDFEYCAVELWRLIAPATGSCEVTQRSRDGGRDAIGEYVIGPSSDPIAIEFALEAKCYSDTNSVGVREVSRLISRLRHRQFGVFVTTSHYHYQAYGEVRSDGHPIALISGRDIVEALRAAGYADLASVRRWLKQFGPTAASAP